MQKTTAFYIYVKFLLLLIGLLFLIHNVFLAGKNFNYSTYKTIKTVEISIVGIIILIVFIMVGMAINKKMKLKKKLTEISKRYHINIMKVQLEFNVLAIHLHGGQGLTLRKK